MLGICRWKIPWKDWKFDVIVTLWHVLIECIACMNKKKYPKLILFLFYIKKAKLLLRFNELGSLVAWRISIMLPKWTTCHILHVCLKSLFQNWKIRKRYTKYRWPATSVPIFSFSSCFVSRVSLRSQRETLLESWSILWREQVLFLIYDGVTTSTKLVSFKLEGELFLHYGYRRSGVRALSWADLRGIRICTLVKYLWLAATSAARGD